MIMSILQVLVITVIITFIFRKDTDMKEFEDSLGQPQNWYDVYSKRGKKVLSKPSFKLSPHTS